MVGKVQLDAKGNEVALATPNSYVADKNNPGGVIFDGTTGTDPISQMLSSLFASNEQPVGPVAVPTRGASPHPAPQIADVNAIRNAQEQLGGSGIGTEQLDPASELNLTGEVPEGTFKSIPNPSPVQTPVPANTPTPTPIPIPIPAPVATTPAPSAPSTPQPTVNPHAGIPVPVPNTAPQADLDTLAAGPSVPETSRSIREPSSMESLINAITNTSGTALGEGIEFANEYVNDPIANFFNRRGPEDRVRQQGHKDMLERRTEQAGQANLGTRFQDFIGDTPSLVDDGEGNMSPPEGWVWAEPDNPQSAEIVRSQ